MQFGNGSQPPSNGDWHPSPWLAVLIVIMLLGIIVLVGMG